MLSLHDRPTKLCDGVTRRELMRAGGLSLLGLSLPSLLAARETAPLGVPTADATFGRAKNVIFLYLAGGPPQHETFDPKPNAPAEVRGEFQPISTNIPGIQFCELLPRTAQIADKLAVVRSIATDDNTHSSSSHWVLTGYKYVGPNPRTINPTDWPYFGSIVKRYKPSELLPPLSTVWIPDIMRLNENVTPAGQTGGLMGSQWNPNCFVGDPSASEYEVEGLSLTDLPPMRLRERETLLQQIDGHLAKVEEGRAVRAYQGYQRQAYELLTTGKARAAFAIDREPDKLRERYGRNRWGQCVLLARRLIEAGVRLVHVQWPREPGDNAVDNPLWDTHAQNADRLEDVLCPQFDVGFSALIEDLDQRGLLDETLVVAIGEFGRTPKINDKGGRDHWGPVFSFAMAGAGISGGQVFGSSDDQGAYPKTDRVEPGHLTATIFHLLGISPKGSFIDREGRPHSLTKHDPIYNLLGTEPATSERIASSGDVARVPPYNDDKLLNTRFDAGVALRTFDGPSRPKGWRASPLTSDGPAKLFGVNLADGGIQIGLSVPGGTTEVKLNKGEQAVLAQEVRSPFAGRYSLRMRVRAEASSREFFDDVFAKQFSCRLVFFQFADQAKSPAKRKELASLPFHPKFAADDSAEFQLVEMEKNFVNPNPGQNFSFGSGLGVAIIVEKTSEGVVELTGESAPCHAYVRIGEVTLDFNGKPRNEDVKV